MSNPRPTRRATVSGPVPNVNASPSQSDLSTLECLILAQAVYEHGADAWPTIAKLLSKHPLLARPKSFFTSQSCLAIYHHLMQEAALDSTEANHASHAPANLTLAQIHYRTRLLELRDLILAEEAKFKRVVAEIDEIRAGRLEHQSSFDDLPDPAFPSSPLHHNQQQEDNAAVPVQVESLSVNVDSHTLPNFDLEIEDPSNDPLPSVGGTHREGKRKVSDVESILPDSSREVKRQRDEFEPDLAEDEEPGPVPEPELPDEGESGPVSGQPRRRRPTGSSDRVPDKRFQNVIGMLHSQISQHRNGNIFHNPIKPTEAPDYHDIIKCPMDLKTIKAKIKDGLITTSLDFQRDVYLMFANAMMYNRPGSDIYHMAEDMMTESEAHINTFRQTEGFVRSTHRS